MTLSNFSFGSAAYILILSFFIGACMGSFVNCIQLRSGKNIFGRSKCTACGHALGILDLFPVLSYIFLRGRCRHCKEKISPRYLVVELCFGAVYSASLLAFGFSWRCLEYLILFTLLGASSLCDISTFEVPDSLALCEAGVWLVFLLTYTEPLKRLYMGALAFVVYGGGILLLSLLADKLYKKDSLGGADIKLIAILGLYFGPVKMLLLLIISCIIGIIFALAARIGVSREFPFIPSIALGAVVTATVGEPFIEWYLSLFSLHIH